MALKANSFNHTRFALGTLFLLFPFLLYAGTGITYHGRILKPDGVTPVTSNTTQFRIKILSPGNEACLLWQEQQTKDLSSSNGIFSITIADTSEPSRIQTNVTNPNTSSPFTLMQVFSNRNNFSSGLTGCTTGDSYNPTSTDGRLLSVEFRESPTDPWEQMPVTLLNSVPMALNTVQLEGYRASEFLKIDPLASYSPLTTTQVNSLLDLVSGTSSTYLKPSTTLSGDISGTYSAASVDKIKGVAISTTAPTNGQILKFNGTAWAPAADDAGPTLVDASYSAKGIVQINTDQATSGLFISNGVLALPNMITANGPIGSTSRVPVITYDQKGRLTNVVEAIIDDTTKLPLAGGTLTGNLNLGTHDITNVTNITTTNLSATGASLRNLILNDNDTNTVTIKTPSNLSANYTLTLPSDAGSTSRVLATDGTGILSWVQPNSGLGLTADRAVIANATGSALTSFSCSLNEIFSFSVTGVPTCMSLTSLGAFQNGGNSFGTDATLGTNDSFNLSFKTANSNRMTISANGNVGLGTANPDSSSILDLSSTAKGFLPPRLTTAQRDAIISPSAGLQVYNTDLGQINYFTGSAWKSVSYDGGTTLNSLTDAATDYTNENLYIGNAVGNTTTTGQSNTGIGVNVMKSITSGSGMVAVGDSALMNVTTGLHNTAVGNSALMVATTGQRNLALGSSSLLNLTTGSYNTAVGTAALNLLTTTSYNTALGDSALGFSTTGQKNTALGHAALLYLTTGQNNIGIGYYGGNNITTGSNNIIIGSSVTALVPTASNQLNIGNLIYGDMSANKYLGIGSATSPTSTLDIGGALTQRGIASPSVSAAGQGRIYFDSTSNKFKISQNGDSFRDLVEGPSVGATTTNVDFANGTVQYTTLDCTSYTLTHLRDGVTYKFIVQGTNSATCAFTATDINNNAIAASNIHLPPGHTATTAGTHTFYEMLLVNGHVYIKWTPGM